MDPNSKTIRTLQNAKARPALRLQAAARLLWDYHHLERTAFLTVYHMFPGTPDELLKQAAGLLLIFTEGLAFEKPRPPAAGKAPKPQPAKPTPPPTQPAKPRPQEGKRTRITREQARQLAAATDPDAPDFEPIPASGASGLWLVSPDPYNMGRWRALINWKGELSWSSSNYEDPIDAQKAALRKIQKHFEEVG